MTSEPKDPLKEAVVESLLLMAEVLANPREIKAPLIKAWVAVLRQAGVSPEEVRGTACRLLATQTFFPTPADFLKALHPPEDKDAAEELAWQRALDAVRRFGGRASLAASDFEGDGAVLWALERMGWERLCRELTEENRAIWRAEFVRLYRAGRHTGAVRAYLPGHDERENLARGYQPTPALVARPDWDELPGARPALAPGDPVPEEGLTLAVREVA